MGRPQSQINICSGVMLDSTYQNTIFFNNIGEQKQYFAGKVVKTFSAYTYLRKDWDIIVQATEEEARSWTYLFFQNSADSKTYYYFINDIKYENPSAVKLVLEMDVMQTFLEEYTLGMSFVEREHVEYDGIGEHLLDEELDVGELVNADLQSCELKDLCVLMLATFDPELTTEESTTTRLFTNVDGVYSGLGIYAVDPSKFTALGAKLKDLDAWGKSDGIVSMWMYPKKLVELAQGETWDNSVSTFKQVKGGAGLSVPLEFTSTIGDNYTPKNKKLLSYPYNFLYVTNNSGASATYHFEKFHDRDDIELLVTGAISPEATCKMHPRNYKKLEDNNEEGLLLGNFPTCAWNQDVYKLWLAQNHAQQMYTFNTAGASMGVGLAVGLSSLATGNILGAGGGFGTAIGGAMQVGNLLAQRKDMEIQPPQSKGNFSASVNIVDNCHTFDFMRKHVDEEHARALDDYFTMYGYKCHKVKIPNRDVRENFTYTKTVGCNVYGNLQTQYLTKIKSIFDNGITFWQNGDLIGNYGLSNEAIG